MKLLKKLGDVDVRLIRVFCAVVRCGGMAAAELELNVGRSTISRHVKELEDRVGATLCQRGRSGFALTQEGSHVYQAAERLLAALDDFQSSVAGMDETLSGHLSIAMFDKTVTNPAANLHGAIDLLHQHSDEVTLDIHVEPINDIERGVMEGDYQIGVIPRHRQSSSLHYLPLFDEQMYLYCSADHPLASRAERADGRSVLNCRLAGMGFHSPNMEVGTSLDWQRSATAYDQEAVATLILSGRYVGFLPEHYAQWFVDRAQLIRLGGRKFQYNCQFAAIYRRAPNASKLLNTFLDCLTHAHHKR